MLFVYWREAWEILLVAVVAVHCHGTRHCILNFSHSRYNRFSFHCGWPRLCKLGAFTHHQRYTQSRPAYSNSINTFVVSFHNLKQFIRMFCYSSTYTQIQSFKKNAQCEKNVHERSTLPAALDLVDSTTQEIQQLHFCQKSPRLSYSVVRYTHSLRCDPS